MDEYTGPLLAEIKAFAARHGMTEVRVARLIVDDGKFLKRLREGKPVSTATLKSARKFLADYERAKKRERAH